MRCPPWGKPSSKGAAWEAQLAPIGGYTSPVSSPPVRIFRLAGARPVWGLHDGTGLYDLSDYLRQAGRPIDLLELAADGWFSRDQLESKLPRAHAEGAAPWKPLACTEAGLPEAPLALPFPKENVGKILALGKNFQAHAAEFQEEVPAEPLVFNKLPETLVPSGHQVSIAPWYTGRVDHEVELAVILGVDGLGITREDAMEHVAFYTLANDLTARSLQGADRKLGYPWFRAKNMDGFCPLGPALVPADYLDPNGLRLTATVGETVRQDASTKDMVVTIPHAIEYLSRHMSLNAGDILLMGTPAGVGPLEDGDVVSCHTGAIGTLETKILRPQA